MLRSCRWSFAYACYVSSPSHSWSYHPIIFGEAPHGAGFFPTLLLLPIFFLALWSLKPGSTAPSVRASIPRIQPLRKRDFHLSQLCYGTRQRVTCFFKMETALVWALWRNYNWRQENDLAVLPCGTLKYWLHVTTDSVMRKLNHFFLFTTFAVSKTSHPRTPFPAMNSFSPMFVLILSSRVPFHFLLFHSCYVCCHVGPLTKWIPVANFVDYICVNSRRTKVLNPCGPN